LNNNQIKLIQTAVRKAGIRGKGFDGRYRMLLAQFRRKSGGVVTSCKQLTNPQLEEMLAICETYGWGMPGKPKDYYRKKALKNEDAASYVQQEAIRHLAGDLALDELQVNKFIRRMTKGAKTAIDSLDKKQAWKIIEALKSILQRGTGKVYKNIGEIRDEKSKEARDGKKTTAQI